MQFLIITVVRMYTIMEECVNNCMIEFVGTIEGIPSQVCEEKSA